VFLNVSPKIVTRSSSHKIALHLNGHALTQLHLQCYMVLHFHSYTYTPTSTCCSHIGIFLYTLYIPNCRGWTLCVTKMYFPNF